MLTTIRKRSEFLNCAAIGQKWHTKTLIIYICPNSLEEIRIGYTVSKKVSKLAVDRNKVKRRLRAIAREVLPENGKNGHDYVIIAKFPALSRKFSDLREDFKYALRKIEGQKS